MGHSNKSFSPKTRVSAYADDVAITISGRILRNLIQHVLHTTVNWSTNVGLGVNPDKTEVVIFSRRHTTPNIVPLIVRSTPINISEEAKYLALILNRKLSCKQNCQGRARKAAITLYTCKNAIGKRWGLQAKVVHWLYTAVVRPIVLYGICVWWTALNKKSYLNSLMKVQRQAELCISAALRTTPSAAIDILLNFTSLHIVGEKKDAKN